MNYGKPNLTGWAGIGSQVFEVVVKNSDGTAYDLTGMTVTVSGSQDGAYVLESVSCTLSATPTDGTVTFTPSSGEIATAGVIDCQLRIANGGAIAMPFPFTLTIETPQYSAGA
jgi:hypothetical protein